MLYRRRGRPGARFAVRRGAVGVGVVQGLGPLVSDRRRLGDRHLDGGDGVGPTGRNLRADPLRRGTRAGQGLRSSLSSPGLRGSGGVRDSQGHRRNRNSQGFRGSRSRRRSRRRRRGWGCRRRGGFCCGAAQFVVAVVGGGCRPFGSGQFEVAFVIGPGRRPGADGLLGGRLRRRGVDQVRGTLSPRGPLRSRPAPPLRPRGLPVVHALPHPPSRPAAWQGAVLPGSSLDSTRFVAERRRARVSGCSARKARWWWRGRVRRADRAR
ncbi:hypothetical protein FBY34_3328 [Streptomyces sp. SLBN-115]|nr:hypothetical protein FBY34_3328 [Streptomyces sp. SLBN-115]